MSKIITAEEFMIKKAMTIPPFATTKKLMIEFAKYHVREAAIELLGPFYDRMEPEEFLDFVQKSLNILYPESNIK